MKEDRFVSKQLDRQFSATQKVITVLGVLALLFSSSLFAQQASGKANNSKPSIVLILTDDQGYADTSVFGQSGYKTPHIDSIAKNGVLLSHFYVAQPVCSASRAAILTGTYPNRIGVSSAFFPTELTNKPAVGLHLKEETLPELLKREGYSTALFGKWHLGDQKPFLPTNHGFDRFYGIPYSNDMWSANKNPHYDFAALPVYDQDKVVKQLTDDQSSLTKTLTQKSIDFISQKAGQPFFLMLAHPQPHVPLFVSKEFEGYTGAGLYADVMAEIDWSTGQVLDALSKHGITDNTLVIFMSDNGPWLSYGNHSGSSGELRNGKLSLFEGGVRSPALIQFPTKLKPNQLIDTPMMSIDLLPTIMNMVNGDLPQAKIDGIDSWAIISGEKQAPLHDAFYFYFHKNDLGAVRYKDWKLYFPHRYNLVINEGKDGKRGEEEWPVIESIELYDLAKDPSETNNVASQFPEVVAKIEALADSKRAELGDDIKGVEGNERRPLGSTDQLSMNAKAKNPVPIIFDTDFGGDADDLGALVMLHGYADKGIIDLLAVTSWANEEYALKAIDAVNHYYGRPDLTLGVRKVPQWNTKWTYADPISKQFPHDIGSNEDVADAVDVYRELLAKAEDNSIVIVTVGPLANIQNLLKSPGDKYSSLDGKALVHQKVKEFVIMGGRLPNGGTDDTTEWNFDGGMPGVSKYVLENIDLPIIFSGFEVGAALKAGDEINGFPQNTPLYVGYKHFSEFAPWMKDDYKGKVLDNSSFDQTAVMYAAINGVGKYWTLSQPGFVSANEKGTSSWHFDETGNHRFLILLGDPDATASLIADKMMYRKTPVN